MIIQLWSLQKISWQQIVFWSISLILAVTTFFFVRNLTTCWKLTALPGVPPTYCDAESENPASLPALNLEGMPGANIPVDLDIPEMEMPRWDGASRINIVFFGLRGGMDGEDCPFCTDTIILMTIDPVTKTAGMLSIPRDMWVNIPGFGYSRINTAWTIGEVTKLPGGGPGLAMETVSQFIGVPVHYYVQVDFGTFVSFINMIGGIDIYVEERMVLDPAGLPAPNPEDMPGVNIPVDFDLPEIEMPRWDGASRINIVFFGLRGDMDGEDCPFCTDTIILMTIDPATRTAGMLSIPRDMWVKIPGFGHSRINTAWSIGENTKLPGGGPGLAVETVSQFLGVPVHYYVQVDFGTFVSFINMIGGIDIYVEERMVLDPAGPGQDHFVLTPGDFRHLNGKRALAYARCRDESKGCSGGDFGRAKRQQKVIMAIRDKIFDPAYFPQLLAQAPEIYTEFSSGIHTNMSFEDALKLAMLVKDIPMEGITQGVIDASMALPANATLNGVPASVLRPVPDLIRILRDEIFVPGGPVSPWAQGDLTTLMQADEARIRVINNTYTADLDGRTANFLTVQGMQVMERGVPTGVSNQTVLVVYSPKLYALRYLINTFGIAESNLIVKPDPTQTVDIEIRIGEDWVNKLPNEY